MTTSTGRFLIAAQAGAEAMKALLRRLERIEAQLKPTEHNKLTFKVTRAATGELIQELSIDLPPAPPRRRYRRIDWPAETR